MIPKEMKKTTRKPNNLPSFTKEKRKKLYAERKMRLKYVNKLSKGY